MEFPDQFSYKKEEIYIGIWEHESSVEIRLNYFYLKMGETYTHGKKKPHEALFTPHK